MSITVKAYAKINLTLDVTGRREDGYHLLRSVMQTVDLADNITICINTNGALRLSSSDPSLPLDERNTVHRAASLFLETAGLRQAGVDIHVEKVIPQQAGLAGGSADAAAVLRGLNRLFETNLSAGELCRIGAMVGADVPFCIEGGAALVCGIGEQLRPLRSLPEVEILIAKPPVGVSTASAYAALDENARPLTRPREEEILAALRQGSLYEVGDLLCNVFEQALAVPEVIALKAQIEPFHPLGQAMTGSGSAVFALFDKKEQAKACATAITDAAMFLCRPVGAVLVNDN